MMFYTKILILGELDMPEFVILLVENKRAYESSVVVALERADYHVKIAYTGKDALLAAKSTPLHLIVFNAASMRSNGSRNCKRLRRVVGDLPIIHVRASNQPEDVSAGATIYLQRPFTSRKLINRVKALLPADYTKEEIIRCSGMTYYRGKRSVAVKSQGENRLTPKLALLLEEFLFHPNEIITRRQLMQNVWQTDYIGDTRTLDVHMRWIRELIEENPAEPILLQTVRKEGYIFCPAISKE